MNRRTALGMIGSGASLLAAGCLSVEEAGPVDFELLNFTEDTHRVAVTITDEDGTDVLVKTYEIDGAQGGARTIQQKGFTEATNGALFDIVVALSDGEPEEEEFRMTCNESDETRDVFLAEIREISEREHEYIEFQQSTCRSGL